MTAPLKSIREIAGYRIIRKLGEGGMGIVFEAEQQEPRRRVALKVVRSGPAVDEHAIRMFQQVVMLLYPRAAPEGDYDLPVESRRVW